MRAWTLGLLVVALALTGEHVARAQTQTAPALKGAVRERVAPGVLPQAPALQQAPAAPPRQLKASPPRGREITGVNYVARAPRGREITGVNFVARAPGAREITGVNFVARAPGTREIAGVNFVAKSPGTREIANVNFVAKAPGSREIAGVDYVAR
ncbi:MAG: hypothetical protein HYU26_09430 [Candidatus Rokubacteria bacterium]|nr:hypothetical protein [Candidatus Rokubacteria bacterium]